MLMGSEHPYSRLALLGVSVASCFICSPQAKAGQPFVVSLETYAFELEPCILDELGPTSEPVSDGRSPISEFRRGLLEEAATIADEDIVEPADKADVLSRLGLAYVCTEPETAQTFLASAIAIADQIEDSGARGQALADVAYAYSQALMLPEWTFDVSVRREALLLEAIALAEQLSAESVEQPIILQNVALQYAMTQQLRESQAAIDLILDIEARDQGRRMLSAYQRQSAERSFTNESAENSALSAIELEELFADVSVDSLYLYYLVLAVNSSPEQAAYKEELDQIVAGYVQSVPLIENAHERGHGFASLGEVFSISDPERAAPFLEQALQAYEIAKNAPVPADMSEDYSLSAGLLDVAASFLTAGDIERGLDTLRSVDDNSEDVADRQIYLLMRGADRLMKQSQRNQAYEVLSEAEGRIQLTEDIYRRASQLLHLAIAYADIEDIRNVQRLLPQLEVYYRDNLFRYDEFDRTQDFVSLFQTVGSYERAVDFAIAADKEYVLVPLPAELLAASQENLADQVLDAISSPDQKVKALTQIATMYETRGLSNLALDAIYEALELAQNADITYLIENVENGLRNPYRSESYTELEIQEILAECLATERSNLISTTINDFAEVADENTLQRALQYVYNDEMRITLAQEWLSVEAVLQEIGRLSDQDSFLLSLIRHILWWEEGQLDQSLSIASLIQSPYPRATALLDVANAQISDLQHY